MNVVSRNFYHLVSIKFEIVQDLFPETVSMDIPGANLFHYKIKNDLITMLKSQNAYMNNTVGRISAHQ